MKETAIGKWLEEDDRERKKIEFKNKLKYGKGPWDGYTTLNPGQQIKIVNGRITVR